MLKVFFFIYIIRKLFADNICVAIKKGVDVLSNQMESLFKFLPEGNSTDISGEMSTQVGEEWRVVTVDQKEDTFDVPEGFEIVEMDETNLFKYLQYIKTSMKSGTIRFVRNIKGITFKLFNEINRIGALYSNIIISEKPASLSDALGALGGLFALNIHDDEGIVLVSR